MSEGTLKIESSIQMRLSAASLVVFAERPRGWAIGLSGREEDSAELSRTHTGCWPGIRRRTMRAWASEHANVCREEADTSPLC